MRALTVRQPWAALILHAGKNIENRRRNIIGSHRGEIAIHAALTYDEFGFARCGRFADHPATRHVGAIVGLVDVIGVHHTTDCTNTRCCEPWGERIDGFHIELSSPRPIASPVPCRGFLGLWTVPADVLAQIEAQR